MKLILTAEQIEAVEALTAPGKVLMGRILRETFTGTNVETSGRLVVELGAVPEIALPGMRDAIRQAIANPTKVVRPKKAKEVEK